MAFFFAFRNAIYKIYKNINENKLEDFFSDKIVIWALDRTRLQIKNNPVPLLFITPCYNNNPNLAAQKGTFSYHDEIIDWDTKTDDLQVQPFDDLIRNISQKYSHPILYKFTLPYSNVPEGFVHIQKIGYTYSKIFPGYASICNELEDNGILRRISDALNKIKTK